MQPSKTWKGDILKRNKYIHSMQLKTAKSETAKLHFVNGKWTKWMDWKAERLEEKSWKRHFLLKYSLEIKKTNLFVAIVCFWIRKILLYAFENGQHRWKPKEEKKQWKINIWWSVLYQRWMVTVFMVFLHVYNHLKCWHPIVWRHLHAWRLLRIYFFRPSILTCYMNKRLEFIMKMLGNDSIYLLLIYNLTFYMNLIASITPLKLNDWTQFQRRPIKSGISFIQHGIIFHGIS